jgi:hypothetical protein
MTNQDTTEESAPVIIELAREFMEIIHKIEPKSTRAFYRFQSEGSRCGSNASYVSDSNATLISALKNAQFYESMNRKGSKLFGVMGEVEGIFLLIIDDKFNYEVKFECNYLHRWEITKMGGGTGVPVDI